MLLQPGTPWDFCVVDLLFAARSEYDDEHAASPNRLVHELYLAKLEHLGKVRTLWLTTMDGVLYYEWVREFGLVKNYTSPSLILF